METIGSYAFYKTAITSITLPSTLISLGEYAFYYCKQLTEITIPGNLSFIAKNTHIIKTKHGILSTKGYMTKMEN